MRRDDLAPLKAGTVPSKLEHRENAMIIKQKTGHRAITKKVK